MNDNVIQLFEDTGNERVIARALHRAMRFSKREAMVETGLRADRREAEAIAFRLLLQREHADKFKGLDGEWDWWIAEDSVSG